MGTGDNSRAIGGGWVGSSAVAETGQRWMSVARTTVQLGAAGWMSEMAGKSRMTHTINIQHLYAQSQNFYGYHEPSSFGSCVPRNGIRSFATSSSTWSGKVLVLTDGSFLGNGSVIECGEVAGQFTLQQSGSDCWIYNGTLAAYLTNNVGRTLTFRKVR